MTNRCGLSWLLSSRIRLSSAGELVVRLATTSVSWYGRPSLSMSTMTWSTGSPVASSMRSIRSRFSHPDDVAGLVETTIRSGRHSRTASMAAV